MNDNKIAINDKIYYTGDMTNASGWFKVSSVDTTSNNSVSYTLKEIDGYTRTFRGIGVTQIGHVYNGTMNPRFVTQTAYNTYKFNIDQYLQRRQEPVASPVTVLENRFTDLESEVQALRAFIEALQNEIKRLQGELDDSAGERAANDFAHDD